MSDTPEFTDPEDDAASTANVHQDAYDFDPHWQGKPLEAFTLARQSLAAMLASHSPGVSDIGASNEAYMPPVWAVLYLCTHQPADWRRLRSRPAEWWEVIEAWAEFGEPDPNGRRVPGCSRAEWADAVLLVYGSRPTEKDKTAPTLMGLWEAARANIVQLRYRPGDGAPGNG